MKKILLLLIISTNALSTELARFDKNIDIIFSTKKSQDLHLIVYQHTLNLGIYSLKKLQKKSQGNGLFLELFKKSWLKYIDESQPLINKLDKSSNNKATATESLHALFIIERTQALYDIYMKNPELRKLILRQPLSFRKKIATLFNKVLTEKTKKTLFIIVNKTATLSSFNKSRSVILQHRAQGKDISDFVNTNHYFSDHFDSALSIATSGLSSVFGAIAGPIHWRDNGQLNDDHKAAGRILGNLQPLDIIFEKKSYKLTNYVIPGFWGHNAIWLGTKQQLLERGLWKAKELEPFREQIESGNSIFDVRRKGITFASYQKWMNLDNFAQVRVKNIKMRSNRELLKIYKILADQIDKKYDFSFDVDSASRITCAEIVYFAYGDISWPLDYILNRRIITPSLIAEAVFYDNSPVEYITSVIGNSSNGAKFLTKEEFGDLMNFSRLSNGSYVQRYKKCIHSHRINRKGPFAKRRKCVKETRTLSL
ncbi:YiiX/YebB-like N1pC/P60 family cysteine hydrolase [Amphritea sp. 2_MG-2023]|uniref:YiiX/YebB-like N1pC/P60 family cysteine hydrolase n=1 Tax=Amphritea TaxID=515417 RepID=UPI001C078187|nr:MULTISPECIES: YiiX/YebB-like N1pC/P60 family cysteine hydrolase [Amphritea]MBU2964709.1 hypothetical protein [Amphritea atlantica]MDO6417106.1 YiiX/YebB-like N1pC/P60 family cysteine hydrolase [Amphritea sp. 2_MG-2023]